jgi:hypothetical protein
MNTDSLVLLILSAIIVLGFGSVVLLWGFFPPQGNANVLSVLTGALAAGYVQVIAHWFKRS